MSRVGTKSFTAAEVAALRSMQKLQQVAQQAGLSPEQAVDEGAPSNSGVGAQRAIFLADLERCQMVLGKPIVPAEFRTSVRTNLALGPTTTADRPTRDQIALRIIDAVATVMSGVMKGQRVSIDFAQRTHAAHFEFSDTELGGLHLAWSQSSYTDPADKFSLVLGEGQVGLTVSGPEPDPGSADEQVQRTFEFGMATGEFRGVVVTLLRDGVPRFGVRPPHSEEARALSIEHMQASLAQLTLDPVATVEHLVERVQANRASDPRQVLRFYSKAA